MTIKTQQLYRLSVRHNGRLYKALSHSVEEDESLFVMNRNPPRPRHIVSGIPILLESGLKLESPSSTDTRSHHVHYHPSGTLIVKARDNATVARIQAPPMSMISKPFLIYFISVAHIEQLAVDTRKPAFGDHAIDLSQMKINRLHIECLIGPKGAFNGPFQWAFGPAQRVVYEDAAFYDVAYFVGEAPPIDPSIEIDGIKLKDTCLTGAPTKNIVDPFSFPTLTPEAWASPGAVARQLRACLETRVPHLASRLGHSIGCYEIRISLCNDGVIAAVDWNPHIQTAQFSSLRFDKLGCKDVLGVVRQGPSGAKDTIDVFDLRPDLCGLQGTVFVRARQPDVDNIHNAMVLRGSELLPRRYWRIPPNALGYIDDVIELIHSY